MSLVPIVSPNPLAALTAAGTFLSDAQNRENVRTVAEAMYKGTKMAIKAGKRTFGKRRGGKKYSARKRPRKSKYTDVGGKKQTAFSSTVTAPYHSSFWPNPNEYQQLTKKVLFVNRLEMPPKGTGTTDRLTDCMYMKGIKLDFRAHTREKFPIEIHMALVQFGSDRVLGNSLAQDFFRADDGSNTTLNFEDTSTDNRWDVRYLINPLNTDNKRVLEHKKWILHRAANRDGENNPSWSLNQSDTFVQYSKYIPINRPVNIQGNTDTHNAKPFTVCIWALPLDQYDYDPVNDPPCTLR